MRVASVLTCRPWRRGLGERWLQNWGAQGAQGRAFAGDTAVNWTPCLAVVPSGVPKDLVPWNLCTCPGLEKGSLQIQLRISG